MTYLATSINESPVIVEKAGALIADVRGKAVKFDTNGNIVLAGNGEAAIGVGIMTNDENITVGADVHVQIKDIGLVRAGAAVKKYNPANCELLGVTVPEGYAPVE